MFDRETLQTAFLRAHGDHYAVDGQLGEGAAGYTLKVRDLRRRIYVCIKLLKSGAPGDGDLRDWYLTSTIKHPLVADTFTVEHFSVPGFKLPCVAIVSRFIEGRNFEDVVLEGRELLPLLWQNAQDLLSGVAMSLCQAATAIHATGHGHGDLHERNVIVGRPSAAETAGVLGAPRWRPVVIDFDNQTFSTSGRRSEETLKQSDVRSLRKLIGMITYGSRWHQAIQDVLASCTTADDVGWAFGACQEAVHSFDCADPVQFDERHWTMCFRRQLRSATAGRSYAAAEKDLLGRVATEVGAVAAFDRAIEALKNRILTDRSYPNVEFTQEVRDAGVEEALEKLIEG
jgi:hypothetical protein